MPSVFYPSMPSICSLIYLPCFSAFRDRILLILWSSKKGASRWHLCNIEGSGFDCSHHRLTLRLIQVESYSALLKVWILSKKPNMVVDNQTKICEFEYLNWSTPLTVIGSLAKRYSPDFQRDTLYSFFSNTWHFLRDKKSTFAQGQLSVMLANMMSKFSCPKLRLCPKQARCHNGLFWASSNFPMNLKSRYT